MDKQYFEGLFGLSGRVAAVTGGTGVLGGAMSRALARLGVKVAVLGRRKEIAQRVANEILDAHGEAIAMQCNVLDKMSLEAARDEVLSRFGRVDILINGAGGNKKEATTSTDLSFFDLPSDAIRWVLGEQKVSTLRTDRMDSVIFNGSKDRRPLSMAEVSLTVHNNKEILASEYSDVVISRRLYRSGESQYFINKSPSRLKDIQNLFMDTGMGANSYSVIELAMVESIISENPADRRHLFEEAAGVTKYKTRRKSALRKLDLTQQDMSRIEDIISEITRNVNSLSRQVGKARRYLKYQDELKKLDEPNNNLIAWFLLIIPLFFIFFFIIIPILKIVIMSFQQTMEDKQLQLF